MKELQIGKNEAGQRFDKFLKKFMPEAPTSFFYKMLRKKNIVLNGKKATGKEILSEGDCVKFFLADETIEKFQSQTKLPVSQGNKENTSTSHLKSFSSKFHNQIPVVFENEDVIIFNKPAGMLSQKAKTDDYSMTEYIIDYMLSQKQITKEELTTFHPSICNRLDRNTSGLLVCGKSLRGLQKMTRLFRERSMEKYYLCIVKGKIQNSQHIDGYLRRDLTKHKVEIVNQLPKTQSKKEEFERIETAYEPLSYNDQCTLLKVHLITGKTHQIRAHLASMGHPLWGDYKYGNRNLNEKLKEKYKLEHQLLHAYELIFSEDDLIFSSSENTRSNEISNVHENRFSNTHIYAALPKSIYEIIKEIQWQHGVQEALEVLH